MHKVFTFKKIRKDEVTVVTIQKISGATIKKIIYQVMNPANGTFENIGAKSMDLIWRIFP